MNLGILLGIKKEDRSWIDIIGWWEIRRIPFNLIVLFLGLLSFCFAYTSIPLIYVFLAFSLNILYCFGWILDIHLVKADKAMGVNVNHSKRLFLIFLVFSILGIFSVSIFLLIN